MSPEAIEDLEIDLVLEALHRRYGFDFRDYARTTLRRRLRAYVEQRCLGSIGELVPRICRNEDEAHALVGGLTVRVTEMFRDPPFFRVLREQVLPTLASFPFIRVWHAGCSTGEEVYSLAILLTEAGLYDRAQIYATDIDAAALEVARRGIYPAERFASYAEAYRAAGGARSLTDYCHSRYDAVILDRGLSRNVVFATHNLATDACFGEMQLILCRYVLIYFNRELQDRALRLLTDSLCRGGVLGLGRGESIVLSTVRDDYSPVDARLRIFRRVAAR